MPQSVKKRYRGETVEERERMKGWVMGENLCSTSLRPPTDESSVRADVSMIKKFRQPRCCLADISAVAKTCPFDYNGRVDYVYRSATKETVLCYLPHGNCSLVPYGWQWHARASNQIKTCVRDVLFNLSSFHERPCHLAAVILFYYHGLACEQFEIIPNKLALIKIYSNKRFDAERLRGKTPKIKYKVYVWFRGT